MKIKFLIAALFFSLVAAAQPSNYIKFNTRGRWIAGMFDSTLHVPRFNGSPSLRTGGSSMDGAIAIDTTNGIFYFYQGGSWKRANIDTSAYAVTSVYRKTASDSVFYVKGGVHTFAFKDSTGGGTPTLQQVLTAGSTLTQNNTITGGLYSFKFTNQNLWSVDTARQWRLRSFRQSDSSMQLIQSSNYGVSGLKRINISSQDTDYFSNIIIDHDHLTNEVYERNPLTLKTAFGQDYNRFSFQGDTGIMVIEANNRRVGIITEVPDSTLHVVGGLKFVTGRQGAGKVLTSDANGGADWATPSGGSYTFTNGLTESGGTVKLGGALTQNTSITNASNYDYKLSLSEDGDNVGFIGTTYSSLLGFENGSGWLRMGSSTYSGVQVVSTSGNLLSVNTGTTRGSNVEVKPDEILINPSVGLLKIDTLTSAVGTKALRYNPTTGLVSYADTTTGGSGGTPAGNYGNVQINRNGAFATPASDSLSYNSAKLTVKGKLQTTDTLTTTHARVAGMDVGVYGGAVGFQNDAANTGKSGMYFRTFSGSSTNGPIVFESSSYKAQMVVSDFAQNQFQVVYGGNTGYFNVGSHTNIYSSSGQELRLGSAGTQNRITLTTGGIVGINSTSPNASAQLDVASTTKGFLPPRMTGTQAEAITSPAEGLMVYATDGSGSTITSKGWWGYDGSTWVKLN